MKKGLLIVITFLLIINYSCKEKIDIEKEKAAIMAVMVEESASWFASDFERYGENFIQDSLNVRMGSSRAGYTIRTGWELISSFLKPNFDRESTTSNEVKTPIIIKVYEETAWVVFENKAPDANGALTPSQVTTCFLEREDGKWKIAYRSTINARSYTQSDNGFVLAISYAKSLGKSVEDVANFAFEVYKSGWNRASGYNGFVTGTLNNWRSLVPKEELKILEQDDSHIVFTASYMFPALKGRGPQNNVSYEEYLEYLKVAFEKMADYMGAIYKQETTPDGVLVSITKK